MRCVDSKVYASDAWQDQNHEMRTEWPDVGRIASTLPVLSSLSSYLWTGDECYPKTTVKRIPVPNVRTYSDGRLRKIKIFFSDTGGGHRASALALQSALNRLYAGRIDVRLVDFLREATGWPWYFSPEMYAALGHVPSVYKKVYDHESGQNSWRETRSFGLIWGSTKSSVFRFLTQLYSEGVDLIVSVHPLINHLVMEAFAEIFNGQNIIPVVTVVTDLGTAHVSWFDPRVDLIFVPNSRLQKLAESYRIPRHKIYECGLPVREGFWEPHEWPKKRLQEHLGLPQEHSMVVLLMGGGQGFGSLVKVAIAIGERLIKIGWSRSKFCT
jgi:1,2-diacylglycerol 3-beta-galactosyltransferase